MDSLEEAAAKRDLDGVLLDYTYAGPIPSGIPGGHFVISLTLDRLDFSKPWPTEEATAAFLPVPQQQDVPPRPVGGIDYRARKIQDGLYLIHWIHNDENHVALLLDFVNKRTCCAALLFQCEMWEEASWDRWRLPSSALMIYQGRGVR